MSEPRVGICCTNVSLVEGVISYGCQSEYLAYISDNGGVPSILGHYPAEVIPPLLKSFDALVFTGGHDPSPSLYGETPHPKLGTLSPARDEFEIRLLQAADEIKIPILCICRGCEMLNIFRGGSLQQHIEGHRVDNGPNPEDKTHPVSVVGDTLLSEIVGGISPILFYSMHHQAVDRLGKDLRISARAVDGIVEAIEDPREGRFVLGVQGHPERYRAPHVDCIAKRLISEAEIFREMRVAD